MSFYASMPGLPESSSPISKAIDAMTEEETIVFEEQAAPKAKTKNGKPSRVLSKVSTLYDRDNKGYLDPTEEALRRMDSQGRGYLDMEKVYSIMQSLQEEQKKSAKLIEGFQKEQKRATSLKRGVIYLCFFAILLALSNIGTSFAAARLAKDTDVDTSSNDLMNKANGKRVATTTKLVEVSLFPLDDFADGSGLDANTLGRRRRQLREVEDLACNDVYSQSFNGTEWDDGDVPDRIRNGIACEPLGRIDYTNAIILYQQFCPNWPFDENAPMEEQRCLESGIIEEVMLNCNERRTRVFGGEEFPNGGYPGPLPPPDNYIVFPTPTNTDIDDPSLTFSFQARQIVPDPFLPGVTCSQRFSMKLYCVPDDSFGCLTVSSFEREGACPGALDGNLGLCPRTFGPTNPSRRQLRQPTQP